MPPPTEAREGCSGLVGVACDHQLDGVVDDVLDVGGMPHRKSGQLFKRHALVHERAGCGEHVDGIGGEALVVALADRGQQPGAHDDIDEELGDAGNEDSSVFQKVEENSSKKKEYFSRNDKSSRNSGMGSFANVLPLTVSYCFRW